MTISGYARMQYNTTSAMRNYNKFVQQGASGKKINSASDDAAGLAISSKMNSQISTSDQKASNALDSTSLSQVKEGALSTVSEGLNRIKTLAVSARGSLLSADQKSAVQSEINSLKDDIKNVYEKTDFNGVKLFEDGAYDELGIKDLDVTGNFDVDKIDDAINKVSVSRANEGAQTNSLSSMINYLNNSTQNLTASVSRIADTDIASLSTRLSQQKVMFQYKMAMQNNQKTNMYGLTNGLLNILR